MSINIIENNFSFGTMSNRSKTTTIVIHHVAGTMTLKSVHDLHKNTNGWAGIGYHFFIDKDGTIYRGRPIDKVGAHVLNHNSYTIGICLNGNFENETPTDAQYSSLGSLIDYVKGMYPSITSVVGHKDLMATACPGANFDMGKIKDDSVTTISTSTTSAQTGSGASSGDSTIKGIQSTINSRYGTALDSDGLYGPKTKSGFIKGFQIELNQQFNAGLTVDGIWGPKTQAASCTVKKGAKGNITYILQALLYCNGYDPKGIDSDFGSNTDASLRAYQKANGLTVDGIAGKNTFSKLLG